MRLARGGGWMALQNRWSAEGLCHVRRSISPRRLGAGGGGLMESQNRRGKDFSTPGCRMFRDIDYNAAMRRWKERKYTASSASMEPVQAMVLETPNNGINRPTARLPSGIPARNARL